jgi:hypothetical protein
MAAGYSLHALAGMVPAKPGLIRDGLGKGLIELEIWRWRRLPQLRRRDPAAARHRDDHARRRQPR